MTISQHLELLEVLPDDHVPHCVRKTISQSQHRTCKGKGKGEQK